jgi:2-dehydro-3-deoxyphosphogluconate aldolase / (4S)-4-hydroxy-2-oxoglutarate aldolase
MEAKDFGFELGHIGINNANESEARKAAELLSRLFGFGTAEVPYAINVNEQIQVLKQPGRGPLGHFSINTNNVAGAKKFLEEKGVAFDEHTCRYTDDGTLWKVWAHDPIDGFSWHLTDEKMRNG